jgi:glycosyltransferase involved in cell wall biosynthesis
VTSGGRIVQVISESRDRGGAANLMQALLRAGAERGWTQLVLNPFASSPPGLGARCEGVRYRALAPHNVRAFPRARRWLRRHVVEFRPDIVHVHLVHAMFAVASVRLPGTATVLTHHHSRYLSEEGKGWAAKLEPLAARRFDRIVAPSESVRRFLLAEYGFPPSKVACIVNGWSGSPILDGRKLEVPTVVCVANFRPKKRHDLLLEAFARVRARIPDARLMLLGDGPLFEQVREQARRLDLEDSTEFPGLVDIWPRLAGSHAFALPSDYEGLPLAVLEAMAAGIPVVASSVEGITDVVRDGVTGFLTPQGDVYALTDRLIRLLSDARLRDRMGRAGREAAKEATMDRCVARYFELFDEVRSR